MCIIKKMWRFEKITTFLLLLYLLYTISITDNVQKEKLLK